MLAFVGCAHAHRNPQVLSMAQQINLCSPILLTEKRYFSANTMAIALAVFLVLGAVLCGAWVWSLNRATNELLGTMDAQVRETESLRTALARSKANSGPVDAALTKQLQEREAAVQERQLLLAALQEGLMQPGAAHSDRLQLIARTVPPQVWVTGLVATGARLEINGYTLEAAALNDWVARLATSPLMQGLRLSDVSVENANTATPPGAAPATTPAASAGGRPLWAFRLVNSQPPPAPPPAPNSTGARP